jgi:arginine deiminase
VQRIELPGTLDGGDVLKVDSTVYVGASSRTNAEGIRRCATSSRRTATPWSRCRSRRRCT